MKDKKTKNEIARLLFEEQEFLKSCKRSKAETNDERMDDITEMCKGGVILEIDTLMTKAHCLRIRYTLDVDPPGYGFRELLIDLSGDYVAAESYYVVDD